MAYVDTLLASYKNANAGVEADAATKLAIDALATQVTLGKMTEAQALTQTLAFTNDTTAVAIATYQFFTGAAPSEAGLAFLLNNAASPNDLNDSTGLYGSFNQESRFINFSINLAIGSTSAESFAASYGGVSVEQTVATAYNKIIGNDVAAAAGVDVPAAVAYLSRAENVSALTQFVIANNPTFTTAQVDLAVKAALIGEILNIAVSNSLGGYAEAVNAAVKDLSDDGHYVADAAGGVDIITAYPAAPAVGVTKSFTVGADTLAGTSANDTFNALSIDANGAAASTFSAFDSLDGGAGEDTLNIYTTDDENDAFPTSGTVKNVEIVNIHNAESAAALGDASKFQGVKQLWQIGDNAAAVTNLAEGSVAGFRGTDGGTVTVSPAAGVSSVAVAFDGASDLVGLHIGLNSATSALDTVTISGNLTDVDDDGVDATAVQVTLGVDVATLTVNTGLDINLTTVENGDSDVSLSALNASASTGGITYNTAPEVVSVTTGSGADKLTIDSIATADNPATAADETESVVVDSGDGKDQITVDTAGTGATTINAGLGADKVTVNGRSDGTLTVDLGAGDDTFVVGANVIAKTDVIHGGDGTDTVSLSAALANTLSANSDFSKAIDGFEKVAVGQVGATTTSTVNLTNLDNINYVSSAGTAAGAGAPEVATVTFTGLLSGQSVTVNGNTYTATSTMTAADVADAFSTAYNVAGYTDTVSGAVVTFTGTSNANLAPLTISVGNAAAPTASVNTTQQGNAADLGATETAVVTFSAMTNGQTVTVDGQTLTAAAVTENLVLTVTELGGVALENGSFFTVGGLTFAATADADAADVIAALQDGGTGVFGNVTVSGTANNGWNVSVVGSQVTFTSIVANADATDLSFTEADGVDGAYTQGATGNLTAEQVAQVFAGGTIAGATLGAPAGTYTTGAASGATVTFTSSAPQSADIAVSSTGAATPTVNVTSAGSDPVAGHTEAATVTFGALKDGQSFTVAGRTITASGGDLTAAQVAEGFFAGVVNSGAHVVISGSLTGWTVANATGGDAELEFTSTSTNAVVTDLVAPGSAATAATAPTATYVDGSATAGGGVLNVTNMAANGTFELTGALNGNGSVALKDATGTADVLNIKLNGASSIQNVGTLTVASVETINITTTDSSALTNPSTAAKLNLVATSATTVTVTGNHGVNFTGSSLDKVVSLNTTGVVGTGATADLAAAAGAVTFTAGHVAAGDKALSILTGMGNDVLDLRLNEKSATVDAGAGNDTVYGTQGDDTINLGAGNDTVHSTAGKDVITLGAGNDVFVLENATHSTVDATQTITDFHANTVLSDDDAPEMGGSYLAGEINGDFIQLDIGGADGIAVAVFANAADAQTFIQNTGNAGDLTGIALDSSTGKLYIDLDSNGVIDSVIQLTGVTTITEAAFHVGIA